MSRSATTRTKSGGSVPPMGTVRLSLGAPSRTRQHGSGRSVPSLQISQLKTQQSPSQPNSQLRNIDKDYKVLYNSYVQMIQDFKDQKTKLKKAEDREKKVKDVIASLEKVITGLTYELKNKAEVLDVQKAAMGVKVTELGAKLVEKDVLCDRMKSQLRASEAEVDIKQDEINLLVEEFEKKITDLKDEHRKEVMMVEEEKEAAVKDVNMKLDVVKQGLAETIENNSSERQQHLDDLKKELAIMSQETVDLQQQMIHLKANPTKCSKCVDLAAELDEKRVELEQKDRLIDHLEEAKKEMQFQLHQQCTDCVDLAAELDEKCVQLEQKNKSIEHLENIKRKMQLQLHQQHSALVTKEKKSFEKQKAMCIKAGLKPPVRQIASTSIPENLANKRARAKSASEFLNARKNAMYNKWGENGLLR